MKLTIVSAVWKRPEVFELFAKGIHNLVNNSDIDISVVIAGSEGNRSKSMVQKHGFIYVEVPNDPLATKMNATTLMARRFNPDYILCVGSDDIISPGLMDVYKDYMNRRIDYIGITDFYFYDLRTQKSSYWGGYIDNRKGHTAGAGRLISRNLMSKWNWSPWEIKDSRVLDDSMQNKLKRTQHKSAIFSLKEKGVYALDIKSSTNMTPFELWDNTNYIDTKIIKQQFSFLFN